MITAYYYAPHISDDTTYGGAVPLFNDKTGGYEFPAWIYFCIRQWVFTNGRMADFLITAILHWFPQWLIALINGFLWSFLLYLTLKISGCLSRHFVLALSIIAIYCLALPWWHRFMLTAVVFNYICASVFGILTVYLYIKKRHGLSESKLSSAAIFIFALITGMMHEAMSFPLYAGIVFYTLTSTSSYPGILKFEKKPITKSQRTILWGMGIGVFFVLFSPGIWRRFFRAVDSTPTEPFITVFIENNFLFIILAILCGCLWFSKRSILKNALTGKTGIFIIAALVSVLFSSVSKAPGRSGFFVQLFSLVAIADICRHFKPRPSKIFVLFWGAIVFISVFTCYATFLKWQIKRGKEYMHIISSYKKSTDGTVYADYTYDYEVPALARGMTLGVPDADDIYDVAMLQQYIGKNKKRYVVVPAVLSNWDGQLHSKPMPAGKGYVTDTDPSDWWVERSFWGVAEYRVGIIKRGENYWTVTDFQKNGKTFFYVTPMDLDFGDTLDLYDP